MKIFKSLFLIALVAMVSVTISCGDNNPIEPTEREILLEALKGTWNLDASTSVFANTDMDGSGISVTFSETGFSLSGEITDYTTGGTYSITDAGAVADLAVSISASNLELDGTPSFSINSTKTSITVIFKTKEADGRVSGLGEFKLVFNKA